MRKESQQYLSKSSKNIEFHSRVWYPIYKERRCYDV
nr:MAG TPA: hypothetical protein [Caudoviricetes sp.]